MKKYKFDIQKFGEKEEEEEEEVGDENITIGTRRENKFRIHKKIDKDSQISNNLSLLPQNIGQSPANLENKYSQSNIIESNLVESESNAFNIQPREIDAS